MASVFPDDKKAAGQRLRRTRCALGFKKLREFAELMDVDESRLGKWESGVALVPPWFTQRMRERFRVTFDWIYGNDKSNLPHQLAVKLDRANGHSKPDER